MEASLNEYLAVIDNNLSHNFVLFNLPFCFSPKMIERCFKDDGIALEVIQLF